MQVPGSAPWIHGVPTQAAGSIPCLLFPRSLVPAVPPLPRHQGILGKLVFLKENSSSLRFPKYRGSTAKPLFFIFPQGCGPQQHRFLFQLDPGIARIPQRVLRLRGGDSEPQRFPRATGTEGLQKTPEQSNSVSASSSFQKHIEKRIILGQSFKIHKWHFLKAQERKKKGLRGIWNYFKPSPNLVQDANMQITIRAGAYFYSASP